MSSLKWNGNKVLDQVQAGCIDALNEFALRVELPAKQPLQFGRGVLTGTYRRSLHGDSPRFNFESDDVKPSASTPERGGKTGAAVIGNRLVSIYFGSGLRYAWFVEKRYGTIVSAHEKIWPKLPELIRKHAQARLK